jgi:hypothetical protein
VDPYGKVIDSDSIRNVTRCNFYNNSFGKDGGLLATRKCAFDVDGCIFSNNTAELYMPSGIDPGFSVRNCVFSGSIPPNVTQDTDNHFNTVTASLAFAYFATGECPNEPIVETPAESPPETPELTPVQSLDATPEESPQASDSDLFSDSAVLPDTDLPLPSPAVQNSAWKMTDEHLYSYGFPLCLRSR